MTITSGTTESSQWQCAGNQDTQTPSCRALAGSLASFECGTGEQYTGITTTDGVPLLLPEETEFETNSNTVRLSFKYCIFKPHLSRSLNMVIP